ncbi:MAG: acyltransferase [Planctomycetota bacterium]|jgi:acetyltransferase-like isoleucine patch superfamily enzyme
MATIGAKLRNWYLNRYYKRKFNELGGPIKFRGKPIIRNSGTLKAGKKLYILSYWKPTFIMVRRGGILEFGEGVNINHGAFIAAFNSVKIGHQCGIGMDAMIMDSDFHELDTEESKIEAAEVVLEDHVWIANRAIVLKGVRIGTGSVVAANSVVTRDVPPNTLVAGIPAKPIKEVKRDMLHPFEKI